jgi:hypothetical protein
VSRAAERLAARIQDLPEGSMRRRVLEGARRFKSSWVELGRLLTQVRREGLWREWGFGSFEQYCAKELLIRRQTADKLTLSFGFLERHEPGLSRARDEARAAPAFEVIEVLSRAEAAGRLSDEGYRELREEVLERGATPAALSRAIAERYGPPPRPAPPGREERLRRLAAQARRLAEACHADAAIPEAVAERASAVASALEALVGR